MSATAFDTTGCEIARLFGAQKDELAATRPDLIVMFDTDHLNTCFLDNLPVFAIGVDDSFKAPNAMPDRLDLTVRDALRWGTANGAHALGLESRIGSLTPGKQVDVIVIGSARGW